MPDDGYARTLVEIASELKVSTRWLRGFVKARSIPVLRSGRIIRFDALARSALEAALRQRDTRVSDPPNTRSKPLSISPARRSSAVDDYVQALAMTDTSKPRRRRDTGRVRRPASDAASSRGFVYFARSGEDGPIKIGTALNVAQRIKGLQTAHFAELQLLCVIPGGAAKEREILDRFTELRMLGEWHRPAAELLAFIEALRDGG